MVKATVKWGKESYEVDIDVTAPVSDFRAALFSLTGVPPDRQKLMSKAWKGVLKDETELATLPLADGAMVSLMGSSEGVAKAEGAKTVFVEDLPTSAIIKAGHVLPAGLENAGNTCYANSTLEAIRFVPEVQDALNDLRTRAPTLAEGRRTPYTGLNVALGELYQRLDNSTKPLAPSMFLTRLRAIFPQFAEASAQGHFKQQDSEEFQNALMTALASELKHGISSVPTFRPRTPGSDAEPNVIDTLFGVEVDFEIKCKETDAEPTVHKREFHRKLVCNIEGGAGRAIQINHMHEGLQLGLAGDLEKSSTVLGRNAVWSRTGRIAVAPRYLCIQMMRFYWKATPDNPDRAGVKCKMLRPVTFQADNMDIYDFCTPSLQSKLKVWRDKHADSVMPLNAKRARLEGPEGSTTSSETSASPTTASAAGGSGAVSSGGGGEDDDLAAALKMSMEGGDKMEGIDTTPAASGAGVAAASADPTGYNLPPEFRGLYDLFAIVTHKGRDADSGHYISWVRKNQTDSTADKNAWLVFDDETVSEVDTDYIASHLKGGGDDHMAYLLFYKAK